MKKILTKKIVSIPAVVILIVVLYSMFKPKPAHYSFITVDRGTVVSEVSVTGNVRPIQEVALSFERSGRIVAAPVAVGAAVAPWQTLLVLDTTNEQLALKQAESSLAADKAKLLELVRGARPEDMAILQSKLDAAQTDLVQARQKLLDTVQNSFTTADDAIRNYADQFFDNPRSSSPQINISVTDTQLKVDVNTLRNAAESALVLLRTLVSSATVDSNLMTLAATSRGNLETVKDLLDKLSLAVNALSPSQNLSASTITTYRTSVSTARAAVNTAIGSLTTNEDGVATAESSLDLAQKNIDLARAGTASEQVTAQEAVVALDQAKIDTAKHAVAVSAIRSPFAGVVTQQDGKVGEVVSANTPVVSVIGDTGFQIEANVPEADIAKLAVGNTATVTLDAYGSSTFFPARISTIDPAETLIDNVATYKVTLVFLNKDERIRSGMTANLDILSATREHVLLVPFRAVRDSNGDKLVRVKEGTGVIDRPVTLGLKGSSGDVEVVSGLSEGETLAIPLK